MVEAQPPSGFASGVGSPLPQGPHPWAQSGDPNDRLARLVALLREQTEPEPWDEERAARIWDRIVATLEKRERRRRRFRRAVAGAVVLAASAGVGARARTWRAERRRRFW